MATGCDKPAEPPAATDQAQQEVAQPKELPDPPAPPTFEDFEAEPQLSLFPRAGDYRPAEGDEKLPYWATFIDHLQRTSGVVTQKETGNHAFSLRSVNTIDSVGYFSPLAVEPGATYTVTFKALTDLPEGASAGIGILEFDQFLWIGEQYPASLVEKHQSGFHPGARMTGKNEWKEQDFTFATGSRTRMLHLVLYREGAHDRKPVLFDEITIQKGQ